MQGQFGLVGIPNHMNIVRVRAATENRKAAEMKKMATKVLSLERICCIYSSLDLGG